MIFNSLDMLFLAGITMTIAWAICAIGWLYTYCQLLDERERKNNGS